MPNEPRTNGPIFAFHFRLGSFTPSEIKRESDISNKWVTLFSLQMFTQSDIKEQCAFMFAFA